MGRIRTIKPEFPQSESMGKVSRDARLLFILLWTVVDDEGRARGNSKMLASLLYPYDETAGNHIDKWMVELEQEQCLVRYEVDGKTYLEIVKWREHQKIDKPSPSRWPSRALANPREPSTTDMEGIKDKEEEQGKEREALVERVFDFFCTSVRKDPKRYTLTADRRRKAELRLVERLVIHSGDVGVVEAEFIQAVKNLAASDFHRTKGYLDWTEQIFRSEEEFQKRLNWVKPTEDGNGANRQQQLNGAGVGRPTGAAAQRAAESRASISRGFDFLRGGQPRGAHAADEGQVPKPDTPGGHAGDVRRPVGRDGDEVRDAGFHGRTIEGHPG